MKHENTATETTTETAPAPVAKAPKQYTFGVTETHKKILGELRNEFTRPAAVAKAPPVAMSEKELIEVLYEVATNRRFRAQQQQDEHGQPVFDGEGQPVIDTVDLFAEEWEKIKARDYVEGATPRDPVAALS